MNEETEMRRGLSIAITLAVTLFGAGAARADYVYYPTYGPLYSGPLVNNLGQWRQLNRGGFAGGGIFRPSYAIAGLNSPPIGRSDIRRAAIKDTAADRRTSEQDQLNTRLEGVMKSQPLMTATVIRVGATAVSVRVEEGK